MSSIGRCYSLSENMFISFNGNMPEQINKFGNNVPELCRFSDFIKNNYRSSYHNFLQYCFDNRLLPFPGNADFYYTETFLTGTEILKIYANRIDQFSFTVNTIVRTAFSNGINTYKFSYRVQGTFHASEKCNFFENIYLFRPRDIPDENILSDYLVPYISKTDLDTEAGHILNQFYPEALHEPIRLNAGTLAARMGYKVYKARLSADDSKLGSIFFNETEVTVYKNGIPVRKTVPGNTILIDTEAHKNRGISTSDVIVHECVHAYEHYLFFFLQSLYNSMLSDIPVQLEEIISCLPEDSPLRWIENQADHMTPRIKMPLAQTTIKAEEFMQQYKNCTEIKALEKLASDLAGFYDVPKITARNRLVELGYLNAQNILNYANGKPVPGYISGVRTDWNKTYTIGYKNFSDEYMRNEHFRSLLEKGYYLYVEGHLCRNNSKYIWMHNGNTCLSEYARTHIDECCLLFSVRHEEQNYEYIPGVLNSTSSKGMKKYLYEKKNDAIEEAASIQKIFSEMPSDFGQTISYHMNNLNMTNERLAELSMLSDRTISRMRNPGHTMPTVKSVVAVSVGMHLYPELSSDLLKKADLTLDINNPQEMCYQIMLRTMYRDSIQKWNEFLSDNGFYPLKEERLAAQA